MNKKSVSFNPRALIGFVPRSLGLLLVILGLIAFSNSSAHAVQCAEVTFEEEGYPGTVYVSMYTATEGATIFFRHNYWQIPGTPTHNGSTPGNGVHVYNPSYPFVVMQNVNGFFKAIAWKDGVCTDSTPTSYSVQR